MGEAVSREAARADDKIAKDSNQAAGNGFKKQRRQETESLSTVLMLAGQSGESSTTATDATPSSLATLPAVPSLTDATPSSLATLPAVPSLSTVRKKHYMKGERICKVCGDKAVTHNFDVITCESCKTFFRRNAHKTLRACQFQDNCEITVFTRRSCPSCRLKKCFQSGMKAELILDEAERKARMEKINNNRKKRMEAAQKHNQNKTKDDDKSSCLSCSPDTGFIDLPLQEEDLAVEAFFSEQYESGTSMSAQDSSQEEKSSPSSTTERAKTAVTASSRDMYKTAVIIRKKAKSSAITQPRQGDQWKPAASRNRELTALLTT